MGHIDCNAEKSLKTAALIVYASVNGQDSWHPLKREEVPEWVCEPDNMAHLVAGDMCCNPASGGVGSLWYRAERVEI